MAMTSIIKNVFAQFSSAKPLLAVEKSPAYELFDHDKPFYQQETAHLAQMIEDNPNMTMWDAYHEHLRLRGYSAVLPAHEMAHVVTGLTAHFNAHSLLADIVRERDFQSTMPSEQIALSIENGVNSGSLKDYYLKDRIFDISRENYIRTMAWLIGKETGLPMANIRYAGHIGMEEVVRHLGYNAHHPNDSKKWEIKRKGDVLYSQQPKDGEALLPEGSNGIDEFKRYTPLTEAQKSELLQEIEPVVNYLHDRVFSLIRSGHPGETMYQNINMGELVDVMKDMSSPSREPQNKPVMKVALA